MRRYKIESLFLFTLFLQQIFDFIMRKAYLPWNPARRWLDFGMALFFVIYFILIFIWLVRLNQKKPNSEAEGTKRNLPFFVKKPICYILLVLLFAFGIVNRMMSFFESGGFNLNL